MDPAKQIENQSSVEDFGAIQLATPSDPPFLHYPEPERNLIVPEYDAIRDLGFEILRRASPENHYYLGVGQSPTAYLAMFELLGVSDVSSIPLSRVQLIHRDYQRAKESSLSTDQHKAQSGQRYLDILSRHREHFLPSEEELAGKKVLAFDWVVNGRFRHALEILSDHFAAYSKPPDVELCAIVSRAARIGKESWISDSQAIDPSDYSEELLRMHKASEFDAWSPYGMWTLHYTLVDNAYTAPTERPEYDQYKRYFAAHMREDSSLETLMQEVELSG